MNFKTRTILVAYLTCIIAPLFFPLSLLEDSVGKERIIKIALLVPQTGPSAWFGSTWQTGIEKAVKEINSKGGWNKMPLKLIVSDTESDPAVALDQAQRLIKEESVKIILGPIFSREARSVADFSEKTKTIFITPAMDPAIFRPTSKYTFKIGPTYEDVARVLATYSSGLSKSRRVAFITSEKSWLKSITKIQRSIFKKHHFQVGVDEKVPLSQRDFRNLLIRIGRSKSDILHLNLIPAFIPIVLRQIHETNLKIQTIDPGILPWHKNFVVAAGTSINKHLSADFPDYNKLGYDTLFVLLEAFTIAGSHQEVDKIRNAMITKYAGLRFYDWGGPRQVEVQVCRYTASGLKKKISRIQFDVPPDPPWEEEGNSGK